jgi:hypothetical protein
MSSHNGHTVPLGQRLGNEHPLCQADAELHAATAQLALTSLFLVGCAVVGGPATPAILMIGLAADFIVLVHVLVCLDVRRQQAIDLIAAGGEDLDAPVVQRVRRELLGLGRLRVADQLSCALEDAFIYADRAPALPHELALVALQDETVEVIELLRAEDVASARAVALAVRLVGDGSNGLACSQDISGTKFQLGRIRFLLRETRNVPADVR